MKRLGRQESDDDMEDMKRRGDEEDESDGRDRAAN
jgi:hypothetical protein